MNISILSALVCLSVGTITQPISIENISSLSEFLVVLDTEESLKCGATKLGMYEGRIYEKNV